MALFGALIWPAGPSEAVAATVAPTAAGAPQTTLLDISILVDESGSLSPADVAAEIRAVKTIAGGGLNHKSRVSVYGFGSQNRPDQNAVDEICPPAIIDTPVKITGLANCAKKLHRRSESEGADTDHAKALAQGVQTLSNDSPEGALKVIFLLTDGKLDVAESPSYGKIPGERNAEAEKQIKTQLGMAATNGIHVWPLGFGSDIDQTAMDAFAAGGSQKSCDGRPATRPRAQVVRSSADVLSSLTAVYAAASCSGTSRVDSTTLKAGETRELHVAIPLIATDGTINVSKVDPGVRVEFTDPKGGKSPSSGRLGTSEFERAGESTDHETLRIVNPIPGRWTIRLTAPGKMKQSLVSAVAIWQGAVSSSLAVEPPVARPGQRLTVRLSLVTRTGTVTNPEALAPLNFTVQATGPGLTGPQSIPLADDGEAPDDIKGDGRYAGAFQAPGAQGRLTFAGVVTGPGILAERVPTTIQVTDTASVPQGQVQFDNGSGVVHPGGSVPMTVSLENPTNAPVNARVVVDGSAHPTLSGGPALTIKPGTTQTRYTLTFPANSPNGGTSATVKIVNAADPNAVYANGLLTVTIEPPPGWVERNRYQLAGAAFLLLAACVAFFVHREAHRRKVDVRGLKASLSRDGEMVGSPLKAPSKWSSEFRFVIRDAGDYTARLDYPQAGDLVISARRGPAGKAVVKNTDGAEYEIAIGTEGEPYEETGLMLAFTDSRRTRRAAQTGRRSGSRGGGHRKPQPAGARRDSDSAGGTTTGGQSGQQAGYDDDPWL